MDGDREIEREREIKRQGARGREKEKDREIKREAGR